MILWIDQLAQPVFYVCKSLSELHMNALLLIPQAVILKHYFPQAFINFGCLYAGFEEFLPEITKSREKYGYSNLGHTMKVARYFLLSIFFA